MEAMPAPVDEPESETAAAGFDMPVAEWRALFDRLADGHADALEQLYDVGAGRLYGFAVWACGSAEDASDIVADVFLKIAEHGDRLRRVRDPRAWLLTVTRRLAIDLARRRQRRPTAPLDAAALLTAPAADPDRHLDAERATALLAALPVRQREVVYLRHFTECTFSTIAKITGVPTFTAASRYRLALRKLRHLMETEAAR